jgi:predicted  nucleic acid-binding Zn-ribbon protein
MMAKATDVDLDGRYRATCDALTAAKRELWARREDLIVLEGGPGASIAQVRSLTAELIDVTERIAVLQLDADRALVELENERTPALRAEIEASVPAVAAAEEAARVAREHAGELQRQQQERRGALDSARLRVARARERLEVAERRELRAAIAEATEAAGGTR